jgi:hypothetical protein
MASIFGNAVQYRAQARQSGRRVWFTGDVALDQGVGLCYDLAYGTAATAEQARGSYVCKPTTAYNYAFAGATTESYPAVTGGQMVEIAEPGSVVEVAAGVDTVVNTTILTCSASAADAGRFTKAGFMGRGSALALQTKTVCIGSSWDGTATVNGTTLTKTGAFTNATAGDRVYIVGGGSDTTAATAGLYTIASVTNANVVVLSSSASSESCNVAFYCISGNVKVLALLLGGGVGPGPDDESGLQEVVTPVDNTAAQSMVGGMTYVAGGYTITTGNSTATLADSVRGNYSKKGYTGLGTITTQAYAITVTHGKQLNKSTALTGISINAAAEVAYLYWLDSMWVLDWSAGATLS